MKTKRKWLRLLLLLGAALGVTVGGVTCTVPPALPDGMVKTSHRITCGEDQVKADFYFRPGDAPRPRVVVAHGFSRTRRYMAGWGIALAERGMTVAILDQPSWAAHGRNAAAISALLDLAHEEKGWPVPVAGTGQVAAIGFSMGGLTSLLATEQAREKVAAWIGLDPVDHRGRGAAAATRLQQPGLILLAEPASFNRQGNGVSMARNYAGPLQMLKVTGASHCDVENPTDLAGRLACGKVDAQRHAVFIDHAARFLEAVFGMEGTLPILVEAGAVSVSLPQGQ